MASLTLFLAFGASFGTLAGARAVSALNLTERAPSTSKKVIVQMFEWNWDSIANECTSFLGPNGYGFVQGARLSVRCFSMRTLTLFGSEPASGTRPRLRMVDRLPTRVIQLGL